MSLLGMLPAILALLGVILLWAVLTYNGINNRKQELGLIEARIQDLKLQRMAFLQKAVELADTYGNQRVVTYFNNLGDSVKVEDLDMIRNDATLHPEVDIMLSEYVSAEQKQLYAQTELVNKKNAYNRLISEFPTRMLSKRFNFKPVS